MGSRRLRRLEFAQSTKSSKSRRRFCWVKLQSIRRTAVAIDVRSHCSDSHARNDAASSEIGSVGRSAKWSCEADEGVGRSAAGGRFGGESEDPTLLSDPNSFRTSPSASDRKYEYILN